MDQPASEPQFSSLPLSPASLANLAQLGYSTMTPIQAASLPLGLAGHDLIAQAKTGSGKTAAFGLVLLSKVDLRNTNVQALVLCPTRELAEQVAQELRRLARTEENLKVVTLCGGTPARAQMSSLEYGAHVVVGTPGRLLDLIRRESLKLSALNTLVFDEADRMLEMGFFDDLVALARACPTKRQTLLFSATYPDGIAQLSRQFLREPVEVKLLEQHASTKIRQVFYKVDDDQRLDAVTLLLDKHRPVSTLAFCNTREQCRDLLATLEAAGFVALALHGELEQIERDQVLIQFANRSCSVLVATDVAARGLDIAQLEAVINVDITPDPKVHTHRIGRTGRIDAEGWAFSLASRREQPLVERIEQAHGVKFEWASLPARRAGARTPFKPPMATFQILGGRREKLRAGDVLGALTGSAGFSASQVGKIHVNEHSLYVAVERSIAPLALQKLSQGKVKGRTVKVRLLDATQR